MESRITACSQYIHLLQHHLAVLGQDCECAPISMNEAVNQFVFK